MFVDHPETPFFKQGLASYRARNWNEAKAFFTQGLALDENDGPCRVFLERMAAFEIQPPPDDWGGVYEVKTK